MQCQPSREPLQSSAADADSATANSTNAICVGALVLRSRRMADMRPANRHAQKLNSWPQVQGCAEQQQVLVSGRLQGMHSPQNLLKKRRTSAASSRSSTFATYTVRPHRSRSSYCSTIISH